MNIVVCVKYVPDAQSERTFRDSDKTVDREGVDGLLSELDEYAVEEALKIVEAAGEGEVTVLTVGPAAAADAIKKALQMGAHAGVHVNDAAIHGSDAVATSLVLAEAVKKATGGTPELVHHRDVVHRRRHGRGARDARRAARPAPGHLRLRAHPRRRHGDDPPRRRHGIRDHRGDAAGPGVGDRPDQRAALPLVQGDHGREEEAGRAVGARRPRHRPLARRASTPRGPRSSRSPSARRARRARSSPTRATAAPSWRSSSPARSSSEPDRRLTGRTENPWLKYSFSSTTPTGACARRPPSC